MLSTLFRSGRRRRLLATPMSPVWLDHLKTNVPLTARLTLADFARLCDTVRVFIAETDFEGCGGLTVTDEMRVTVAGHAALLLVGVRHDHFERVRTVLLYPSAVVPPAGVTAADGVVHEGVAASGQASSDGPVVLAWDEVFAGGRDDRDGQNVVLHEFAHQLDFLDGAYDGVPRLAFREQYADWRAVTAAEFAALQKASEAGTPTLLDTYGATNPAEFFAVATEAFFERPVELRERHPNLYRVLAGYYGQTPAEPRPTGPAVLRPYRGSRPDAAQPVPADWPGWVGVWGIEPGQVRYESMAVVELLGYVAVGMTVGCFVMHYRSVADPWVWKMLLVVPVAMAVGGLWLWLAVRWVDDGQGWAGQGMEPSPAIAEEPVDQLGEVLPPPR